MAMMLSFDQGISELTIILAKCEYTSSEFFGRWKSGMLILPQGSIYHDSNEISAIAQISDLGM
jgi:hypothetical protein